MESTTTTSPTQTRTSTGADFMAQPARFRASLYMLLLGVLVLGCTHPDQKVYGVVTNIEEGNFHQLNGVVQLDDEPYTGTIYTLFPDTGDTLRIVRYLLGREHGIWKQFYPNQRLREIRKFERGQKVGDLMAWYENGRKQLHYHFENDEYEGTCREWNADGRLVQEMNYHRGHEEGPQKMFYDNGKVRANYVVRKGRRYGLLGTKNCVNVSDSVFVN